MLHKEGLRPLLFFHISKLSFKSIKKTLDASFQKKVIKSKDLILSSIHDRVLNSLDEFWAPIIVKEIQEKNNLSGKTPSEKYVSFFLEKPNVWKKDLFNIPKKYPEKFKSICLIIQNEIKAIELFIKRITEDHSEIKSFFKLKNSQIIDIKIGGSDRHQDGKTTVTVFFSNKEKILYKPKSSDTDTFFEDYVKTLDLKNDFLIKTSKHLNKHDYSWHGYLENKLYSSKKDLKSFYRNFGAMIAVCDSLNYTDGHSENFICTEGKKIILIDTETIFTNLSYFKIKKVPFFFDLEFTGIIQDLKEEETGVSALQDFNKTSHYPVNPQVFLDCTSDAYIRYKINKINLERKSYPSLKEIKLEDYIPSIIEGMAYVYDRIIQKNKELNELVVKYQNLKTRQIKRQTLYYIWILHKSLHPLTLDTKKFISEKLDFYKKNITNIEAEKILKGDIPLFFHDLKSCHLYGEKHKVVSKNYTKINSFDWYIQKQNAILEGKQFLEKRKKELIRLINP